MKPESWRQQRYDEVFEAVVERTRQRRARDPDFTVARLTELLETEYVNQGNDWIGRGALREVTQAATIAAYERVLTEWRAEEDAAGK